MQRRTKMLAQVRCLTIRSVGLFLIPLKEETIIQQSKAKFPRKPSEVWDRKKIPMARSLDIIILSLYKNVTQYLVLRTQDRHVELFSSVYNKIHANQ